MAKVSDSRHREVHDLRDAPGFVLDRAPYDRAKILVANANFGSGSSREGAAYAFRDAGFRALIAPSFGDIFFNNCLKNGIVPVRLPGEICSSMRKELLEKPGREITIDLETVVQRRTGNTDIRVTHGTFVFVAIDEEGKPRAVPREAVA